MCHTIVNDGGLFLFHCVLVSTASSGFHVAAYLLHFVLDSDMLPASVLRTEVFISCLAWFCLHSVRSNCFLEVKEGGWGVWLTRGYGLSMA